MVEWNRENVVKLIDIVSFYPILWIRNTGTHDDMMLRKKSAWYRVAKELQVTFPEADVTNVFVKWQSLCMVYWESRSDSTPWIYSDKMNYLSKCSPYNNELLECLCIEDVDSSANLLNEIRKDSKKSVLVEFPMDTNVHLGETCEFFQYFKKKPAEFYSAFDFKLAERMTETSLGDQILVVSFLTVILVATVVLFILLFK